MKKIYTLLSLLLFFIPSLASCSNEKEVVETTNYTTVNDFETIDDVILNNYIHMFGKIGLNKDKNFITSGNGSVLLSPKGDKVTVGQKPRVKFNVNKDIRDLTKYTHLKFDFFNDSDIEVPFTLRLNFNDGKGGIMSTMDKVYKLDAKKLTTINHRLDVEVLSLIFNVSYLENIELMFDYYDESPKLYLDNLSFRNREGEYKEQEIILDENEICSFDKSYQSNSFLAFGYGNVEGFIPQLSINTNPMYAKDGKSLKMLAVKGNKKEASWPYIKISPKIIQSIDFSKYSENDEIVLDVYSNGTKTINFSFDFHASDDFFYKKTFVIKPQQWNEMRISLKEINSNSDAKKLLSDNLSYINICYGEFADRNSEEFYFDSFRIEKKL